MSAEAQAKLDALKALDDGALLEKAWHELNALCGNVPGERRKEWIMHIPVDAERDSDVIFGEVLMRFGKLLQQEERIRLLESGLREITVGYTFAAPTPECCTEIIRIAQRTLEELLEIPAVSVEEAR